ncbi:MAG: DUF4230 domain-containing protein [Acidimicrobiales bacterium]
MLRMPGAARRTRRLPAALALLAVGVVAGLGAFALVDRVGGLLPSFERREVDRAQPALLESLEELSSFHAATANVQVVVDLEEDVAHLPDFVAGQRSILVAAGSVDAAVDFSGLASEAVEVSSDRRRVTVTLPAPQRGAARLDMSRTYVAARNRGLLDRVADAVGSRPHDDQQLYQLAEVKLGEAAAASGVESLAEANTRAMLDAMLRSLGFEVVEVRFVPALGR